jgi:dGTPase
MVGDVIARSRQLIDAAQPRSVAEVRHLGRPVIRFSDALWGDLKQIRAFLFARMYRAPAVNEMRVRVHRVVSTLFPYYLDAPDHLPEEWRRDVAQAVDETALARLVSDYIAGMTDRFALQEYARLTGEGTQDFSINGV